MNNAPLMKWSGGEEEYVYIGSDIILSYPFFPASKQSSYNDFDGLAWYSADGDELTPDFTNIPTGVSMVEAGNNIAGYKFTSTGTYVLEVSVSDDYALDSKTTTVTKTIHIVDWMAPDVNVSYSTTEPTNQDVVATITLPDGVTSSNGVVHTFTENGSFDFNLTETATNQSFVVTATVNNIEIIAEGEQEESQDSALVEEVPVEEVPVEEVPVEEVPVEEVPVEVQLPVVEADVVEESAVDLGSDDIIDETTYEVVKVVQVKNDQEPLAQVVIHTGTIIKKADDNTIYTGALLAPMYIEESTAAELYEEVVENTEIVSVYEVGSETEHFIFENKLYTLTLPTNGSVNPHIYTLSGSDWVIQDTNEVVTEFYISADIEHMSKFAVIADAPEQQEQQPTQINTSGGSSGGG
ncbi:MAG: hypothetical protein U9Q15_05640 [Patescibacteria group bacterium]|nr:hypothetical protein [Patescibacteria group bacterium]